MARLSAFADEMSQDFREQLDFLDKTGLSFLEIRFVDGENIVNHSTEELRAIKTAAADHGIGFSAIGSPVGKVGITEDFTAHFDLFKKTVEVAELLDCPRIRVFSYYPPKGEHIELFRDRVINRLQQKVTYLSGSDIVLLHENEAEIFGHSAENCAFLAETLDSKHFQLAYDPGNFVWGEAIADNMDRCWPLMEPFVAHVHIKDWKMGSAETGELPGNGDGEIALLLDVLAKNGYDGYVTMEPHLDKGGQFGGKTKAKDFGKAIEQVRQLAEDVGLELK